MKRVLFTGECRETAKRKRTSPATQSSLRAMETPPGMESIFIDAANMLVNMAPCELRSTETGYYLPLQYSQIIAEACKRLKFVRMRTVILVPEKLFGGRKKTDCSMFDVVAVFRSNTVYVIAMVAWESDQRPVPSPLPPYLLNLLLRENTWALYDAENRLVTEREKLSTVSRIKIHEDGVKLLKIGNRLKLVKDEIILNAVEMPSEYNVVDMLQDPMFRLLDTIRFRRYFDMAIKEFLNGSRAFYRPKYSSFKLTKHDVILDDTLLKL